MSNFHTVLDSGKVMPAKNVVSTGAKLVQGPQTPLISKELVIVKNYWKMLNVQKNTSLPENEWPGLVFVSDVML
jgi:hypothetical protein